MSRSSLANTAATFAMVAGAAAAGLGFVGYSTAKMGVNPFMTDYEGAVTAVESQMGHLTDVKATGYGWFSCGIGESAEMWRTQFTGINTSNGKKVHGVVCEGVLRAPSARTFD